ncbi:hypothetical protein H0G86_007162 [Trichoderma simmonsii]|uniref:Uncharacterized protein n=1 Tax=Trichoderma simmonsii TaxID=1491479 RepID=A0A8G0LHZ2_9HYPO|nr:hypothetical protein H0G86_007162 [Trichoderma simmonsii]
MPKGVVGKKVHEKMQGTAGSHVKGGSYVRYRQSKANDISTENLTNLKSNMLNKGRSRLGLSNSGIASASPHVPCLAAQSNFSAQESQIWADIIIHGRANSVVASGLKFLGAFAIGSRAEICWNQEMKTSANYFSRLACCFVISEDRMKKAEELGLIIIAQ